MIIKKKIRWNMGHALAPPYQGQCARCHGHNFEAWFEYEGELGEEGMVLDTSVFKIMQKWVDEHWDHRTLISVRHPLYDLRDLFDNDSEQYGFVYTHFNPTSENIAKCLHEKALKKIENLNPQKLSVTVQETETIIVTYKGEV